jgi:SAM-dependent methyltransferase
MTGEQVQTWHYGLMAQWWAEFNLDGPEIAYYQGIIERYGQPALDMACGTGRLLLPFLRAGLDVDGADVSPDMLDLCRDKAVREGFAARLYAQAMHELDLPRKYKTILVCGSFGLGGDRKLDLKALQRFHCHLEPGGVLAFDCQLPYGDAKEWQNWLPENRSQLPQQWHPPANRRLASDGTEYSLRTNMMDLNPLEQIITLQMRAERWRDGQLIEEEERTLRGCLYFKNELLLMLECAGFSDVTVYGGYTELEGTVENTDLIFVAKK